MTKKNTMKKEVEKTENEGEQLDLIDVQPENKKEILEAVKCYKKFQTDRLNALAEEVDQKAKVLDLIHKANLQPLADGKIKFKCENYSISVVPSHELIKIKEDETV